MTEHIPVRKRKGAETRARRTMTAKEGAARLGVSPRTIQRIIAEPREEFEARARQRRERAAELRASGLKYKEIAEEMDISIGMVGSLLHDARKHEARKSTKRGSPRSAPNREPSAYPGQGASGLLNVSPGGGGSERWTRHVSRGGIGGRHLFRLEHPEHLLLHVDDPIAFAGQGFGDRQSLT